MFERSLSNVSALYQSRSEAVELSATPSKKRCVTYVKRSMTLTPMAASPWCEYEFSPARPALTA
jgi:hypothetical protein